MSGVRRVVSNGLSEQRRMGARSRRAELGELIRAAHPGPSALVTVVTVLLAVGVGYDPARVALVGLAMLLGHSSIGFSNDWRDFERDRASERLDKPLVRGALEAKTVRTTALVSALLMVPASLLLGPAAAVVNILGVASGWLYNFRLKGSRWSPATYAFTFGTLPLFVTLGLAHPHLAQWWAVAAGAVLGLAAHFSNVLPDLQEDVRNGVGGLPQRAGLRASSFATIIALAIGSLIVVEGLAIADGGFGQGGFGLEITIGLAVTLVITTAAVVIVSVAPTSRWLFRVVLLSATIDVVLLELAGPVIVIR